MFVLGAFGFLHELFSSRPERPITLALIGALMGLPWVLAADRKIRKLLDAGENDDPDGSADRWSHLP